MFFENDSSQNAVDKEWIKMWDTLGFIAHGMVKFVICALTYIHNIHFDVHYDS